ncbi:protein of unknown function [Candidatus Filomicrobium marinum]|uniref:Uncharacterized protein n=1 Tax=Candidatus Filomicrobium marinum TaxID=1608628 RepID=A0A0D6JK80_9HYPH|nr:protein of unknown function [Candidatus Filomicrobium marinum]CPR22361.1 protein of unknown function [Candidatus Filomicrobium marinum]
MSGLRLPPRHHLLGGSGPAGSRYAPNGIADATNYEVVREFFLALESGGVKLRQIQVKVVRKWIAAALWKELVAIIRMVTPREERAKRQFQKWDNLIAKL